MIFADCVVQRRELFEDSTQFSPILLSKLNYSTISITRKDNKRLPVGQMVVNNQGKIVSLNQKFISIWKLPEYIVTARCERQVFWFIAEQLSEPHNFLVNIKNIKEQRSLETQGIVKLKDGRSFSHLIKPQWLEKTVVGRIYRFSSYSQPGLFHSKKG